MRLVRSKGNSKDCKNSRYKEQTLPPWLRFMPKQEHLQGWDPDLGEGTAVGQWMKSHRESHREVPVLLRWWNLLEIHPLELAGKSLFGTCWTSTMWNLPSEICPLRFWKKLAVEKDLTAGILPQNCPEGRVAGAGCCQLPCTAGAGHWESWVGTGRWTLKSCALQEWVERVEWVHRNQEAVSFPLAMSLQYFLQTKLKSSQLAKEKYFKDLDAFSQSK